MPKRNLTSENSRFPKNADAVERGKGEFGSTIYICDTFTFPHIFATRAFTHFGGTRSFHSPRTIPRTMRNFSPACKSFVSDNVTRSQSRVRNTRRFFAPDIAPPKPRMSSCDETSRYFSTSAARTMRGKNRTIHLSGEKNKSKIISPARERTCF